MTGRQITVRLFVDEEVEDWGDGDVLHFYKLRDQFELVDTDIPKEHLDGIAESWAQSDHYYEVIQNLVGALDD